MKHLTSSLSGASRRGLNPTGHSGVSRRGLCVIIVVLLSLITISQLSAQSMGINNSTPDPTSILDVTATDRGILIPRMSGAQRIAIGGGNPATGLLVFDTDTSSFWYYNGVFWEELGPDTDWVETPTTVTTTKAVGIGTATPAGTFELKGAGNQYLRTTTTNNLNTGLEMISQGSAGDWRITNDDQFLDIEFSTNEFASSNRKLTLRDFNGTARLGVGIASPATELHVNGTIRSTDLSGSGTRHVMVNGSGELIAGSAPATSHYYSIGPYSFTSGHASFTLNDYAYNTSGSSKIIAPINLPHGATVTSVKIYYIDNSSGNNLDFSLFRRDVELPNSTGNTVIASNSFGTPGFTSWNATGLNISIDNENNFYEINVQPIINQSWDGNQMQVKSVVISYTLP